MEFRTVLTWTFLISRRLESLEKVKIIQTAHYVPDLVVSNDDLSQIMTTSDEWISKRTGIKRRHVSLGENTSDLCTKVASDLLAQSGWQASQLDLIIVATMSPDAYTPATAAIVQGNIEATNAFAFDLAAACSGFAYAFEVASQFITTGRAKKVMVLGGEVLSKVVDWQDRTTAVLFGDGAAGVLLTESDDQAAILASDLQTFGSDAAKLSAGLNQPLTSFGDFKPKQISAFAMDGHAVYNFATREVPASLKRACDQADLELAEIDHFILHQANERIIKAIAKRLKLPLSKFAVNISEYGNTSAASEPILLDELVKQNKVKRGQIIALSGFGGGLTVGTQIIRY